MIAIIFEQVPPSPLFERPIAGRAHEVYKTSRRRRRRGKVFYSLRAPKALRMEYHEKALPRAYISRRRPCACLHFYFAD